MKARTRKNLIQCLMRGRVYKETPNGRVWRNSDGTILCSVSWVMHGKPQGEKP